jgi:hypothetical protein
MLDRRHFLIGAGGLLTASIEPGWPSLTGIGGPSFNIAGGGAK